LHGRDATRVRDLTSAVTNTARYIAGGIYVASQHSIDFLANNGGLQPLFPIPSGARATALGTIGDDFLTVVYEGADPQLWRRRTPSGAIEMMTLPRFDHYISSIDVAADRCTMFYATVTSIERFDVCSARALPTFTHDAATTVRVLPDGGVIAAYGRDLVRYDTTGNRIARFTVTTGNEGIGSIALDANPSLLWVVTTFGCGSGASHVLQIDTATGSITAGPQPASHSGGFAIAVQGEWRAAVDAPPRRRAVR
jgi:hypothetical protein